MHGWKLKSGCTVFGKLGGAVNAVHPDYLGLPENGMRRCDEGFQRRADFSGGPFHLLAALTV